MKNISLLNWILFASFAVLTIGCKPENLALEIYTSDVEIASLGQEIIDVSVTAEFTLLGEDEEGVLDQVIEASKKYLSLDTTYSRSKALLGEQLVIETKIPMTTPEGLDEIQPRLAALIVTVDDPGSFRVDLVKTEYLDSFDNELTDINFLLGLHWPASESVFRMISDSRKLVNVQALAVFVSKKPYLVFERTIKRRESVEVVFRGGEGSVYSELDPVIGISID